MDAERKKLATALGYYARARNPGITLAKAAEKYAQAQEYRIDVDFQLYFGKGFVEAQGDETLRRPYNGSAENEELAQLCKEIRRLTKEFYDMRADLHQYAQIQEMRASAAACMMELDRQPTIFEDPFHNQDS